MEYVGEEATINHSYEFYGRSLCGRSGIRATRHVNRSELHILDRAAIQHANQTDIFGTRNVEARNLMVLAVKGSLEIRDGRPSSLQRDIRDEFSDRAFSVRHS